MTAALEEGEWSAARPGRTLPPGKTRYPFYRRQGGPHGLSERTENLVPTGIRSRTVQSLPLVCLFFSLHVFGDYVPIIGKRGSKMVKVLCYNSEGRRFDPSWWHGIFNWQTILPIALWPWGRLSIQKKCVPGVFPGGKGGRSVKLTTLPPSCAAVMKCGHLNFLEPSGPVQACNGTALLFLCVRHQEKQLYLCDTWYLLFCVDDCLGCRVEWWWTHSRPKHVEKRNKHTNKNFATSWIYLQDYTGVYGQKNVKFKFATVNFEIFPPSLAVISSHNTILKIFKTNTTIYFSTHWFYLHIYMGQKIGL